MPVQGYLPVARARIDGFGSSMARDLCFVNSRVTVLVFPSRVYVLVFHIDWAGGYDLQNMNQRRKDYIHSLQCADQGDYSSLLSFVNFKTKDM